MTMLAAIGEILPFAVGMAVFPIPIIAAILLLFSPQARANGLAFMTGWICGVGVTTAIFALLADRVGADTDRDAHAVVSWIKLLLGVGLLYLSLRQWRSRPAPEQDAEMPAWMKSIDRFTPGKSLRTALLLSAGNPKNLALAAAAGGTLGQAGLTTTQMLIAAAVFTSFASATIAGPVLYYLRGGKRAEVQMEAIKGWLIHNSNIVMALILLIIGAVLLGNGIVGLSVK